MRAAKTTWLAEIPTFVAATLALLVFLEDLAILAHYPHTLYMPLTFRSALPFALAAVASTLAFVWRSRFVRSPSARARLWVAIVLLAVHLILSTAMLRTLNPHDAGGDAANVSIHALPLPVAKIKKATTQC